MAYKPIPVSTARAIATEFDKDQVIIVAWQKDGSRTHITTFGNGKDFSRMAAEGGKVIEKCLGLEGTIEYENYIDERTTVKGSVRP